MTSDRSVYFTKTAHERHNDWLVRKAEARHALIQLLVELNHANVHPLNDSYWTEDKGEDALIVWAGYMGLLTRQDHVVLRGW